MALAWRLAYCSGPPHGGEPAAAEDASRFQVLRRCAADREGYGQDSRFELGKELLEMPSSTAVGVIWRALTNGQNGKGSTFTRLSWTARSSASSWHRADIGGLEHGVRPEASIAAVRSLRKFDHRLCDTLACAGTMPSSVRRIAARSSGIPESGSLMSLP